MRDTSGEIDIIDYLSIVRRRSWLISLLSIAGLLGALAFSFLLEDRYVAKAVISPVKESGGQQAGLSLIVQQLESVPTMSFSSPSSAPEILALLNSNMLRRKLIEQHGLLPVIFKKKWDTEKGAWADGEDAPTVYDGLRALERTMSVKNSTKENTITITLESADPEDAAEILSKLLGVLSMHLGSEARRVAESNRRYLEGQLSSTADPLIRQNIYTLIAQQIESGMMAGVMENFAFKVIDQPYAPDRRSFPKRHLMALAGFAGAFVCGVLLALVLEYQEARAANGPKTGRKTSPSTERE